MSVESFRVGDIQSNPFRHLDRYPIRREKVEALRESLRSTGFWDNVVARIGESGTPEIAYGHHRLIALKEEFGADAQVSLIIRKLDNETMLKIMAQENMEEWDTAAVVVQETLRAVVEAYADGHIDLGRPNKKAPQSSIIYAPSFIPACGPPERTTSSKPYTLKSLGGFLGLVQTKWQAQGSSSLWHGRIAGD